MAKNPFLHPPAAKNPFFDAQPSRLPSIDFDPFAPTPPRPPTDPATLTAPPREAQTSANEVVEDHGAEIPEALPLRCAEHPPACTTNGMPAVPEASQPAPPGGEPPDSAKFATYSVQPFLPPNSAPRVNPFDFCDLLQISSYPVDERAPRPQPRPEPAVFSSASDWQASPAPAPSPPAGSAAVTAMESDASPGQALSTQSAVAAAPVHPGRPPPASKSSLDGESLFDEDAVLLPGPEQYADEASHRSTASARADPAVVVQQLIVHGASDDGALSLAPVPALAAKLAMLDATVRLNGGPIIGQMLFHMRRTLTPRVLSSCLSSRPAAARMYARLLDRRRLHDEASAVRSALSPTSRAMSLVAQATSASPTERMRLLPGAQRACETAQLVDAARVGEALSLLQLQDAIESVDSRAAATGRNAFFTKFPRPCALPGAPLAATLYYCRLYHPRAAASTPPSVPDIIRKFSVSDKLGAWIAVAAAARAQAWEEALAAASTKPVFGSPHLKPWLQPTHLVDLFRRSNAPLPVLERLVGLIELPESRFAAAHSCACYPQAVEALIVLRERLRLQQYVASGPASNCTAATARARAALNDSSLSWK